jgi:aspartate ammonia-lyase
MEPEIAQCIFEPQTLMHNAARTLREHCIEGITANEKICRDYVERSIGIVTALNPIIGYKRATEIAAEAQRTGKGVVELVREGGMLTEAQIRKVLDPKALTEPHARAGARREG